jgi:hypothetical protein
VIRQNEALSAAEREEICKAARQEKAVGGETRINEETYELKTGKPAEAATGIQDRMLVRCACGCDVCALTLFVRCAYTRACVKLQDRNRSGPPEQASRATSVLCGLRRRKKHACIYTFWGACVCAREGQDRALQMARRGVKPGLSFSEGLPTLHCCQERAC